jgi:hypothetical protein
MSASMSTPATFTDQLRMSVALMQAAHPEKADAIGRAHAAIIEGHVIENGDGTGRVLSRNGSVWHTTNGACDCTAAAFGKTCRHLEAWKLYQHVAKKWSQTRPPAAPAEDVPLEVAALAVSVPAKYLQLVKGKLHVRFVGLLAMAHEQGLRDLRADFTHIEAEVVYAHAVAVFSDGRRFEESGDATPANAVRVGEHWRRLALTRAKARALRDALNIGEAAVEELE